MCIILISGAINFIGNLFLIPKFGASGAAISTLISYEIMTAIALIIIRYYLKLTSFSVLIFSFLIFLPVGILGTYFLSFFIGCFIYIFSFLIILSWSLIKKDWYFWLDIKKIVIEKYYLWIN